MENKEEILEALDEFAKHPGGKISHVLEQYLCRIATTGVTIYPWKKLKPLLLHKLDTVVLEFQEKCPMNQKLPSPNVEHVPFEAMRKRLLDDLNQFNGIPFTIQRLCELVTNPTKHYQKTDKYMRGVEKNLLVVTTIDPYGNRIFNENKIDVNGTEVTNSHDLMSCPDQSMSSPFLPPAPVNSPATSSTTTTTSWFSSLSNVVDSPSSYPNWTSQEMREDLANAAEDGSESVEPPWKMLRLDTGSTSSNDMGGEADPSTSCEETDNEEQKTIAPLLTQLLSNPNSSEQVGSSEMELLRTNDMKEESASNSSTENTAGEVTESYHALGSANAFNSCSSDENVNQQSFGKHWYGEQMLDLGVTTSNNKTISTAQTTDPGDDIQKTDGLELQNQPAGSMTSQNEKSEWASPNDSSSNVDDNVSSADSDCGVSSIMETSEMPFLDSDSCDAVASSQQSDDVSIPPHGIATDGGAASSEAESESPEESFGDVALVAAGRGAVGDDSDELEPVVSSHWGVSSPSSMDTE